LPINPSSFLPIIENSQEVIVSINTEGFSYVIMENLPLFIIATGLNISNFSVLATFYR